MGNPPFILGYEGAGVIEYVGEDVHCVKVGDSMPGLLMFPMPTLN